MRMSKNTKIQKSGASCQIKKILTWYINTCRKTGFNSGRPDNPPFLVFFRVLFQTRFLIKISLENFIKAFWLPKALHNKKPGKEFYQYSRFLTLDAGQSTNATASYKAKSIHLLMLCVVWRNRMDFPVLRSGEIDFWKKSRSDFFQKIDCERNFSFAIDFLKKVARDFFQKSISPPK